MSEPNRELEVFARLASPPFEAWLAAEEAQVVSYLKSAGDAVAIHRAQGKALFIDDMKKLLAKAKSLR